MFSVKIVEGRNVVMVEGSVSSIVDIVRARWMIMMVIGGDLRKRDVKNTNGGEG